MGAPKGNTNGARFTATIQPKKRGRKKSRFNDFVQAFKMDDVTRDISKEDTVRLLRHILNCSKAELELIARNHDLPILILSQIQAIVSEIKNGKTDTVDKLFDRIYGKTPTTMEVTGAQGSPLIPETPMSRQEYQDMLTKLKCGAK